MMKIFRIISLLLIVPMLLCGCTSDAPAGQSAVELYFVNAQRDSLTTETVYIKDSDFSTTKTLVYAVMEKLLDGPSSASNSRIIPEGVTLRGFSQSKTEKGTVNIDLGGSFYQRRKDNSLTSDEILARYSIICTLCQFENIRKVKFYVNGEEMKTQSGRGDVIQPMGSDSILMGSPSGEKAQTEKFITLYFTDESGKKLYPETRKATMSDNSLEKTIVNELIEGPVSNRLERTIPKSTKLISIETAEEVCFVNLSADFIDDMGENATAERVAVYSIVNSLTRIAGIEKVQILVDGKKPEKDISRLFISPLGHNDSIVAKEDDGI